MQPGASFPAVRLSAPELMAQALLHCADRGIK
jgi:hypothetical protein